jgi:pentatricopeptide repeat protein
MFPSAALLIVAALLTPPRARLAQPRGHTRIKSAGSASKPARATLAKAQRIALKNASFALVLGRQALQQPCSARECNQLIRVLGDGGHLEPMTDFFGAMVSAGVPPTQITYGTLISRAGKSHQPQLASRFYRDMLRRGLHPDVQTLNSLINAYSKAGLVNKAYAAAGVMRKRGIQPTLVTYNTLLDACARSGNVTLAHQTVRELTSAKLRPNARTFSILIHLSARASRVDEAFWWFRRMVAVGETPNAVTFTTLINACGRSGELERAFSVLAEMRGAGLQPNVVTYTTLIDACAKRKQVPRAVAIFRDMIADGVPPNRITCTALFHGCLAAGEILLAREVLAHMRSVGLKPSAYSFTALLSTTSSVDTAQREHSAAFACLLRQLSIEEAAERAAAKVLSGSTPGDDTDGAAGGLALDDSLGSRGSAVQPFLADSAEPPHEALRSVFTVFSEMKAAGVVPDRAAFNALIDACASVGDVARAEGAFGELCAAGITPDAISYTCLIKACAAAGEPARAERILREMQQKSNHVSTFTPPTVHTYFHLMAAYAKGGAPLRVLELLQEMEGRGLAPTNRHYALALQTAAQFDTPPLGIARVETLYSEMREAGCRLDTRTLLVLDGLCRRHGRLDLARRLRRERSI